MGAYKNHVSFDIQDVNPLNIMIFMSLGLFPFIISCVLLIDRLGQKASVLPFIITSFALGGFALLPYFILREPNPHHSKEKAGVLARFAESKITAIILALLSLALIIFGLTMGDFNDYWFSFNNIGFINIITILLNVRTLSVVEVSVISTTARSSSRRARSSSRRARRPITSNY
jgi:hypothetical protein